MDTLLIRKGLQEGMNQIDTSPLAWWDLCRQKEKGENIASKNGINEDTQ